MAAVCSEWLSDFCSFLALLELACTVAGVAKRRHTEEISSIQDAAEGIKVTIVYSHPPIYKQFTMDVFSCSDWAFGGWGANLAMHTILIMV